MISGKPPAFPPFPHSLPFAPDAHPEFLTAIQGNVLKGHGGDRTRLLFFVAHRQNTDPGRFLREAVPAGLVTPAARPRPFAPGNARTEGFASLMLTKDFFLTFKRPLPPESGGAFRAGAFERLGGDDDGSGWQPVYRAAPHGLWLLADRDDAALDVLEARVRAFASAHQVTVFATVERGRRWHDAGDRGALREPFGFRDGISVASFLLPERAAARAVQIPLEQVLIPEGEHAGGTFFVLQKLEQNVAAFRRFETALREVFVRHGRPLPVVSPGALLVGRERDGTPLAAGATGSENDFDFAADAAGARCPFHAHIRKANPRGASEHESAAMVLSRQFVRRSAVYDDRAQLPEFASADYPEGNRITADVGLLFMGYMRNILSQFEHVRLSWMENLTFPMPGDRLPDPLANRRPTSDTGWRWRAGGIAAGMEMPQFITPRGALFCYVPSVSWLGRQ